MTATWWYTATAVLVFESMVVLFWCTLAAQAQAQAGAGARPELVLVVGGTIWVLATLLQLSEYRHGDRADRSGWWLRVGLPVAVSIGYGVAAGIVLEGWLPAIAPIAQSLVLIRWPAGVRVRVVALATVVLVCAALVDRAGGSGPDGVAWWAPALFAVLLPLMSVSSLWWWDVLVVLDRARISEARLAAAQERLSVATDVHDLQGHHLQVIALQLELAERLLDADPGAALEQLRAARSSVNEARQGTRDLATRFRTVPLTDELANARDLLAAAGLTVTADIAAEATLAPTQDLGPVIRETTTNVLRHGNGRKAHLELSRGSDGWRYEISNSVPQGSGTEGEPEADGDGSGSSGGSGIDGIRRRIAAAGGTLQIHRGEDFVLTVTVPDTAPEGVAS